MAQTYFEVQMEQFANTVLYATVEKLGLGVGRQHSHFCVHLLLDSEP
jgi:hypothetical protein